MIGLTNDAKEGSKITKDPDQGSDLTDLTNNSMQAGLAKITFLKTIFKKLDFFDLNWISFQFESYRDLY